MTHARLALGLEGETLACRALESRGHVVVARRYRTRHGELDIVTRHGATVVIVEVKTRRSSCFGDPATAVTPQKQQRLIAMASDFLARHGLSEVPVRFDVVSVQFEFTPPEVTVYEDAFRPGW